ncbi:MAG: DegV family protein [Dehalococcoidia bacterium]|nr:DegV family protein [Dehalococcoidia bacterium]
MGIAIIADSISCITKKQAEDYGIRIIPVNILFNGQISRDVIDLSLAQAYGLCHRAGDTRSGLR